MLDCISGSLLPIRALYIRIWGKHLIVGREEAFGPDGALQKSDRVRLTRLNVSTYGLSVKRHTGRWEKTPYGAKTPLTGIGGCFRSCALSSDGHFA